LKEKKFESHSWDTSKVNKIQLVEYVGDFNTKLQNLPLRTSFLNIKISVHNIIKREEKPLYAQGKAENRY